MVDAFLSDCFASDQPHLTDTPNGEPWTFLLSQLRTKSRALESASVALAAAALGFMHDIPHLKREGLKFYTKGLQELQIALWDKNLRLEDATLTACMALIMYEVVECPGKAKAAYDIHHNGVMALVRARGVAAHTSGTGFALFSAIRYPGVIQAVLNREPDFLSEPLWMEGPWALFPKAPMDRINDCLALSPAILQKASHLVFLDPKPKVELARQLAQECLEIDKLLDDIYVDIQSIGPGPLYWNVVAKLRIPTDINGPLFPVVYFFKDLKVAWLVMTYWAARLMLWVGLCDLYDVIEHIQPEVIRDSLSPESTDDDTRIDQPCPSGTSTLFPQLGHRKHYRSMAHNVCQSIEYFLQPCMKMGGAFSVSSVLGVVLGSIIGRPSFTEEATWMRAVLGLVQRKGHRLPLYSNP
ncbi:hypothetical protein McanMca71_004617 [Microsporum canis]